LGALCFLACFLQPASSNQLADGKSVGRLFGGYSTRTRLSTLTSTLLFTCASVIKTGALCKGKKRSIMGKRRIINHDDIGSLEKRSLDSSQDTLEPPQLDSSARDEVGKLFIALTTFTTITTTSFAYNMSTTVSISFSCMPLG
ncbi:unnamed protein product, partial [Meganyctiphanes norvegica]